MQDRTTSVILRVTGLATLAAGAVFAAPTPLLRLAGIGIGDPAALLFIRHWGLLVFCLGALLVHAASHPDLRRPVLLAAAVEKTGLVAMLAVSWSDPALQGLHAAALLDGPCALLYGLMLMRSGRAA